MIKRLLAILLAVLMTLSLAACGEKNVEEESSVTQVSSAPESSEEQSKSDWRENKNYYSFTAVMGGRDTDFLMEMLADRIIIYYDTDEQSAYGTAVFPAALSDAEFTRYQTELKDIDDDGYADLVVPYLQTDSETTGYYYYLWDKGIKDFIYDSEYDPDKAEEESSGEIKEESSEETSNESSEESAEEEKKITLYLDMSYRSGNAEVVPVIVKYDEKFSPADAVNTLADMTWLNFALVYQPIGKDIYVYWDEESTLFNDPTSLNPEYSFKNDEELRWFMLDTLNTTLKDSFGYENVWFMDADGDDLVLAKMNEVTVISTETAYQGSAYHDAQKTGVGSAKTAQAVLEQAFAGQTDEGVSVALLTEGDINGEHCYIFMVAENGQSTVSGETYFAVSDSGSIYAHDISTDTYIPYTFY